MRVANATIDDDDDPDSGAVTATWRRMRRLILLRTVTLIATLKQEIRMHYLYCKYGQANLGFADFQSRISFPLYLPFSHFLICAYADAD